MSEELVARQFWIEAPGRGGIRSAPIPRPGPGEVLVRALYSGISRGTESLVFKGRVPESQHESMRAPFQEGDFPAPVKYGYLSVGEVVEAGEVCDRSHGRSGIRGDDRGRRDDDRRRDGGEWAPESVDEMVGRAVFCLHPHQDRYVVPVDAVTPLPPEIPSGRAVLAGNMETAINAVWDGEPGPGQRITVVGAGVVGLLVAHLCAEIPGTEVQVVDINPAREGPADALGLEFSAGRPEEAGSDLVFHASGTPAGLRSALDGAGPDATVVEVSWFGDTLVELPLGEAFHSRRLTIRSSQVGGIPPARRARWDHRKRRRLALDLLHDSRLDALITGESPFEELPRILERLSNDPGDTLCHRIRYAV